MVSIPSHQGAYDIAARRSNLLSGNGLAVAAMVLFVCGFPAAEILLDHWHPISLMMLRLSLGMAALLPLWILMDGLGTVLYADWRRGIWVGMLGFGTGTNLLLFAQWYTDPLTVALIVTTTPISATIIEVLNQQRRLNGRFLIGLGVSVLGGVVALGSNLSLDLGWGVVLAVASGFCFTWASNAAIRDFPTLSPLGRSTITFSGALLLTVLMFAGLFVVGQVSFPVVETSQQLGLLVIYAVAAMALSQVFFIASVGRLGIAVSSFHLNTAPFYLMLILFALGEAWDWRAVLGAAIVAFGVVLSQTRSRAADGAVRVNTHPTAEP